MTTLADVFGQSPFWTAGTVLSIVAMVVLEVLAAWVHRRRSASWNMGGVPQVIVSDPAVLARALTVFWLLVTSACLLFGHQDAVGIVGWIMFAVVVLPLLAGHVALAVQWRARVELSTSGIVIASAFHRREVPWAHYRGRVRGRYGNVEVIVDDPDGYVAQWGWLLRLLDQLVTLPAVSIAATNLVGGPERLIDALDAAEAASKAP